MDKQISLSAFNDELAQVRTKKKEFLELMDRTHSAVCVIIKENAAISPTG